MYEAIRLGPFVIKLHLVALFGAGVIGYWFMKRFINQTMSKQQAQLHLTPIGNAVFYSFIIWKFSYFIFHPFAVINYPPTLLYFSGGYKGWILAVMIAFFYLRYQAKKREVSDYLYFQWVGLWFTAANGSYHLFYLLMEQTNVLFGLGQIGFSAIMYLTFYKGISDRIFQGWIWFGIGQIALYFLIGGKLSVLIGLSPKQTIYFFVSLLGFVALALQKQRVSAVES
ncbi:hypothetical protein BEP19_03980 [Ammoniphilus oxalaticus]|uniref:Prolipoprotein diacylglyceryl transferase n=1 Tax=Ammoniphilus oxalaticus TaxID=66863 RepID=A0A419SLZ4_9BACL|nr:hypothetical protein [Ammoniphilus oxalaticus]RKD25002.1 hypothetical protein BEP19_03980 [Ammoniphilus oxalaticus]